MKNVKHIQGVCGAKKNLVTMYENYIEGCSCIGCLERLAIHYDKNDPLKVKATHQEAEKIRDRIEKLRYRRNFEELIYGDK